MDQAELSTRLIEAVQQGDVAEVKTLCDIGANVNICRRGEIRSTGPRRLVCVVTCPWGTSYPAKNARCKHRR